MLKANLNYASSNVIANQQAEDAKQMVIKSHSKGLKLKVWMMWIFLYVVEIYAERYPGVLITNVKLERVETLNAAMLRQIGSGKPVPLVKEVSSLIGGLWHPEMPLRPESGEINMSRYFKILACVRVFFVAGLCCSGVVSAQEKVKTFGTIDSLPIYPLMNCLRRLNSSEYRKGNQGQI